MIMGSSRYENPGLHENLERRIVHGLYCEWENAALILPPNLHEKLKKPLISIGGFNSRHGYWKAESREILISRSLVMNHAWDDVVEVLVHETAHQVADEILGTNGEPAHGKTFINACHLLRANPKASGSYKTLHERIDQGNGGKNDRILERIKKLMALAESKNHHEAQSAAAKAHFFIQKYNVDLIKQKEKKTYFSVFLGKPALRHFREAHHMANLLQDFYFVQVIWVSAYVLKKSKMGRVLEISGLKKNIQIASYVYDYIHRYIDHSWSGYNRDKGLNRYRKTDFAIGIIKGFYDKLRTQTKTTSLNNRAFALIKSKDNKLSEYLNYRHPYIRKTTRTASNQDDSVLAHGFDLGTRLVISKGVSESVKRGLLIAE